MKSHTKSIPAFVLSILILVLTACQNDEPGGDIKGCATHHRIAVICPSEMADNWESTAAWALENIRKAQIGQSKQVEIDIEWIDEATPDLAQKAYSISNSGDYELIIGPYSSAKAHSVALQVEGRIPMLLP